MNAQRIGISLSDGVRRAQPNCQSLAIAFDNITVYSKLMLPYSQKKEYSRHGPHPSSLGNHGSTEPTSNSVISEEFSHKLRKLESEHATLINRSNEVDSSWYNGVYTRYRYPVLTAAHVPLEWRFDLDSRSNPFLMERLGVNAVFNPGAILFDNKIRLVCRVEGYDRKSFFAVAESESGIDDFRFFDYPLEMPGTGSPETNLYDMRLTRHEDGWIYGLFCTEKKDPTAPLADTSSAVAQCGVSRTKDLLSWERLPDLVSRSPQQRNVVLHPEFVKGKYALYTRPQDSFIDAGSGLGIGWALCDTMEQAEIDKESVLDPRVYHSIKEAKNGQGPPPIKTHEGWIHLAHGVRQSAAGLRYVLYVFMTSLDDPWRVIRRPSGYFLAPTGDERVGELCNITFVNGWVERDGEIFIYYASGDTRIHVAATTVERLLDYTMNTPEDPLHSAGCVAQRTKLIRKNRRVQENSMRASGNMNCETEDT